MILDDDELPDQEEVHPPAPPASRKPPEQDIRVSATQYVRIRKYRWERAAGFLATMKRECPGNRTRTEWDQLWDAFWARPV